jgi:hypothetical protein
MGKTRDIPDGPYFGQKPPGLRPVVFAPGIICLEDRNEGGLTFSPDGREIFFDAAGKIHHMHQNDGHWTQPAVATFLGSKEKAQGPRISPDGRRLAFMAEGDLWLCKKSGATWSEPQRLPAQINSEKYECRLVFTAGPAVYYTSQRPGSKGQCDVFCTQATGNGFSEPKNKETFNTPGSECGLYVAPDESFLIFTGFRRKDGFGSQDMYITFRTPEASWSKPRNMGPAFNTPGGDSPIGLTPDRKYFLLNRGHKKPSGKFALDIYWGDAAALDQFRPQPKQPPAGPTGR